MLKDVPSIFGLEAGIMGVVGIAIWDASSGTQAGITASTIVKGICMDVVFITTGAFRVRFNPQHSSPASFVATKVSPLLYTTIGFGSGDLVTNTNAEFPGRTSSQPLFVDINFRGTAGSAFRNPAVCHVTIFGRVALM